MTNYYVKPLTWNQSRLEEELLKVYEGDVDKVKKCLNSVLALSDFVKKTTKPRAR